MSETHDAAVGNAADPQQVKAAARRERRAADFRREVLATQMSTPLGRAFVWQELERHRIFASVTAPGELIHQLSGRRDAGLELLASIMRDWPREYVLMQNEALAREEHARRAAAPPPREEADS